MDRPVAVVSNVATTPALLMVHVDQLNRPVKMTDAMGADVWSALYSPFGGAYTLSGSETLNARFPGQWFQMEAGLHYNRHRHYDPSLGRYTQPDPLGFVDGQLHDNCYDYCSHALLQEQCILTCNQWLVDNLRHLPGNS
ncbi:MAG: RHS repeat domain-containing protein [Hyphomicrobium sp.]